MYLLRQLDSSCLPGTYTDPAASADLAQQVVDVNSRYIMALTAPGQFSSDFTQVASLGSFTIPLPQAYDTTKMLHVALATTQTIKLTTVSTVNGTSVLMVRAGLAADQPGLAIFCGQVSSLTILNSSAATATVEWFLFQLPAITTNAGWRDGALATGVLGP